MPKKNDYLFIQNLYFPQKYQIDLIQKLKGFIQVFLVLINNFQQMLHFKRAADDTQLIQIQKQVNQFFILITKFGKFFINLKTIILQPSQQKRLQNLIKYNQKQQFQINPLNVKEDDDQTSKLFKTFQQYYKSFFLGFYSKEKKLQKKIKRYETLLTFKNQSIYSEKLKNIQQKVSLLLSNNYFPQFQNIFKSAQTYQTQTEIASAFPIEIQNIQPQPLLQSFDDIYQFEKQFRLILKQLIQKMEQSLWTMIFSSCNQISQNDQNYKEEILFQIAQKQYGKKIQRNQKNDKLLNQNDKCITWTLSLAQSSIKKQNLVKLKTFNWCYLTSLHLDSNQINDEGWLILMEIQLPKLQILTISKNRLRNLKNFHKICKLQRLELTKGPDNNQLSDITARQIISCEWPNLTQLRLNFHFMTYPKAIQLPNYWQIFMKYKFNSFPKLKKILCGHQEGITSLQTFQKLKKLSQQVRNGQLIIQ